MNLQCFEHNLSLRRPAAGSRLSQDCEHIFLVDEAWTDGTSGWRSSHYRASTLFEALEICDATPPQRHINGVFLVYRVGASGLREQSRILSIKPHPPYGVLCRLECGLSVVTSLHSDRPLRAAHDEISLVCSMPGTAILGALAWA